jgi:glycosyltransferase involved in cell wall biosynthesis
MCYAFHAEGFRITWVGPERDTDSKRTLNPYGINYHLFPAGASKLDRIFRSAALERAAKDIKGVGAYYAPDPDSAPVAIKLARKNGARVIFDIHEEYHDAMLSHWVPAWMKKHLGRLVVAVLKRRCSACDLVVGVSDAVLLPYRGAKVDQMVVRSCAPVKYAEGSPADVCSPGKNYITVMHGKGTLGRGTDVVLRALSIIKERIPHLKVIIFDIFIGQIDGFGREVFLKELDDLGIKDMVDLRPLIPPREMPAVLRSCDVGLIAYNRILGAASLPNRLFEYMAAGLPVIAPSYSQEIVKIVNEEKCGLLIDFENPQSLADALIEVHQNPQECRAMGRRARAAFLERHNWEVEVRPMMDWIDKNIPNGRISNFPRNP